METRNMVDPLAPCLKNEPKMEFKEEPGIDFVDETIHETIVNHLTKAELVSEEQTEQYQESEHSTKTHDALLEENSHADLPANELKVEFKERPDIEKNNLIKTELEMDGQNEEFQSYQETEQPLAEVDPLSLPLKSHLKTEPKKESGNDPPSIPARELLNEQSAEKEPEEVDATELDHAEGEDAGISCEEGKNDGEVDGTKQTDSVIFHSKHKNTDKRKHPFSCYHCNAVLTRTVAYTRRECASIRKYPSKCSYCKAMFVEKATPRYREPNNNSVSISNKANIRRYICNVCHKGFKRREHKDRHEKVHYISHSIFECNKCDAVYSSKRSLWRHKLSHLAEKPFKCDICDKKFVEKSKLILHVRTHTKEKPFKCKKCGDTFSQSCHLSRHIKLHSQKRAFKCAICDKDYKLKEHLSRHIRKSH